MKNPLNILDVILADWVNAKVRRTIHLVLLLAAVIVAIYLGVDEDWKQFVAALLAAFYAGSNAANTDGTDSGDEDELDVDTSGDASEPEQPEDDS